MTLTTYYISSYVVNYKINELQHLITLINHQLNIINFFKHAIQPYDRLIQGD